MLRKKDLEFKDNLNHTVGSRPALTTYLDPWDRKERRKDGTGEKGPVGEVGEGKLMRGAISSFN